MNKYWRSVLLSMFGVLVISVPKVQIPTNGADHSWQVVVGDYLCDDSSEMMLFSHGPLAPIFTSVFVPEQFNFQWDISIVFYISIFGIILILSERHAVYVFSILVIVFATPVYDGIMASCVFLASIYIIDNGNYNVSSTNRLCQTIERHGLQSIYYIPCFIILAFTSYAKFSLFIIGVSTIIFAFIVNRRIRSWHTILLLILTYIVSWYITGRSFADWAWYNIAGFKYSQEYEAYSLYGPNYEIILFIFSFILYIITGLFDVKYLEKKILIPFTIMSLLVIFISFKAGFIRHDKHSLNYFSIMSVFVLFQFWFRKQYVEKLGKHTIISSVLHLVLLQISFYNISDGTFLLRNYFSESYTKTQYLLNPSSFFNVMKEDYEVQRSVESLPEIQKKIGRNSVDVISYGQSAVFYNNFNYSRRPVFQSYLSVGPFFQKKNGYHMQESSPEYILYKYEPIDQRYFTQIDSYIWRSLYKNYQFICMENEFALFKNTATDFDYPKLSLHQNSRYASFGEVIELPDIGLPIYVSLDFGKSLFGHITSLLYKNSHINIFYNTFSGVKEKRRILPELNGLPFHIGFAPSGIDDCVQILDNPQIKNFSEFTIDSNDRSSWNDGFNYTFFTDTTVEEISEYKYFYDSMFVQLSDFLLIDILDTELVEPPEFTNINALNVVKLHAPSRIRFSVDSNTTELQFSAGILRANDELPKGDGVFLKVGCQIGDVINSIYERHIRPDAMLVNSITVPIPISCVDNAIVIQFDPGPNDDTSWDWSFISPVKTISR